MKTTINRRTFLKTTAATTAGAFILPRFSIGQAGPSANSKVNIAMIGDLEGCNISNFNEQLP